MWRICFSLLKGLCLELLKLLNASCQSIQNARPFVEALGKGVPSPSLGAEVAVPLASTASGLRDRSRDPLRPDKSAWNMLPFPSPAAYSDGEARCPPGRGAPP